MTTAALSLIVKRNPQHSTTRGALIARIRSADTEHAVSSAPSNRRITNRGTARIDGSRAASHSRAYDARGSGCISQARRYSTAQSMTSGRRACGQSFLAIHRLGRPAVQTSLYNRFAAAASGRSGVGVLLGRFADDACWVMRRNRRTWRWWIRARRASRASLAAAASAMSSAWRNLARSLLRW
jgi:hypothetical protein